MKRIGTQRPLGDGERARLVDALRCWRDGSAEYWRDRAKVENLFNCRWEGQDASGTVRGSGEREARPFKGASDQRIRWGKATVRELEALLMNATRAASVNITCTRGGRAQARANALQTLLGWAISRMGAGWEAQLRAAIKYYLRDTPAIALVKVEWRRSTNAAVEVADRETMCAEYAAWRTAGGEVSQADAQGEWWSAMTGGGQDAGDGSRAMDAVMDFMSEAKGLGRKDARAVIEALAADADGEVEYVRDEVESEGPAIRAMRYGDDFCMPTMAEDFGYAQWFEHEWMTAEQLDERVAADGWSSGWAEETKRHPGQNVFDQTRPECIDDADELYSVVTCHHVEVDARGRTWRWTSVLSAADGSAYGKRLVRTRRGKWDAVMLRREVNSSNLIDAEGIAEEAAPVQGIAKVIRDGAANNAIVGAQSPIKQKGRNIKGTLIGPFRRIMMGVNDDVTFMQPPQYPAAADKQVETIRGEFLNFEGVGDGERDVSGLRQDIVSWWLAQMQELYRLVLEVTQDNASDETLAGVTDAHDVRGLRREDIAGDFGIAVTLDQSDLDNDRLIRKLQTFAQLIQPLDRNRILDTNPILMDAVRKLMPGVARASMRAPDEVRGDDLRDEAQNFVQIKAGVMPQMDTEGNWNYRARLDFYRDMMERNPAAIETMTGESREMLDRWMAALEQQDRQFGENAEIGRTGVEGMRPGADMARPQGGGEAGTAGGAQWAT